MEDATHMTLDAQQQFEALLQRHQKIVFKVASTYCSNPADRRDLEQEIATQLWKAFPRYEPARAFSTWAYRIALNVGISYLRGTALHRQSDSLDEKVHHLPDAGADPETTAQLRALQEVISRLDPLNRALLLLYLEEHSYREIAEVLGISETNVATKLSRLKQRIREDA